MTIKLNEQQLNNLRVFLARVDLKGSEVGAFNELASVLFGGDLADKEKEDGK